MKVAIVTGGTKGIGKAIADELTKQGVKVVVCAHKKQGKHDCIAADVSNAKDVKKLVDYVIKKYKRIDILVNNAGIYPFVKFKNMTEKQWDEMMDVNLKGMFNTTKEVLKYMKKGRIINISSVAGTYEGYSELVHYCTTKAGVVGFTKSLAMDLAPNITVNAIAPGLIETPGTIKGMGKKGIRESESEIPMKRAGKPQDIANLAAFLASDKSEYITGQLIVCDGGLTCR